MSTTHVNEGETLSAFARRHGFSRQRAHTLKKKGLPVLSDGSVNSDEADRWLEANINQDRRPGRKATSGTWKEEKERADALLRDLELRRRQGELIERADAERAAFERAQRERHAWQSWTATAAAWLASELGVPERDIFDRLDRLVRDHLDQLADEPMDNLNGGNGA